MSIIPLRAAFCLALISAPIAAATPAVGSEAEDRFLITELMDRYGVVHDFGTPEEYADLFTPDGEIGMGKGPALIKGRDALIAQARRDHEKYVAPTGPNGENEFFMRHIVSNRVVELTGPDSAKGNCYVITLVNAEKDGAKILSFSRYFDNYQRVDGEWRIARRDIHLGFGDQELAARLGFR